MPEYIYTCNNCNLSYSEHRLPENRDSIPVETCPCCRGGKMLRDTAAQFRSSRIWTPKLWNACTSADLEPTREERIAQDKSFEDFKAPEKKPGIREFINQTVPDGAKIVAKTAP